MSKDIDKATAATEEAVEKLSKTLARFHLIEEGFVKRMSREGA